MPTPDCITAWEETMRSAFPHLSRPQVRVLAEASYGVMAMRTCGMTTVATFLAILLNQKENTVRQRLREWAYGIAAKRGAHRQELDVAPCFVPLVRWILSLWQSQDRRVVLALDATTLGTRFTVLSISLVIRGTALPIAWAILPACAKGAWKPQWLGLLRQLEGAFPSAWQVLVMADRGLYAKWLYRAIQANGWHPFLRITAQGTARAPGQARFHPLRHWLPARGCAWRGRAELFSTKEARLSCTLLGYWDDIHAGPWLIVTDLGPEEADVQWYALRGWIEQLFKDLKRGGWQWQDTHMTDPQRAARWWLVLAVATVQVVALGVEHEVTTTSEDPMPVEDAAGQAVAKLPETDAMASSSAPEQPIQRRGRPPAGKRPLPRGISVFVRGCCRWAALVHRREPIPPGRLVPEPWPTLALLARQQPTGQTWEQQVLWPELAAA